ncbi:MAG: pantoate--beta-alanine ligase [Thermomicrobiales bacterium]|nr:pantoate--beta-alanine ligase [Thermomicrobiales bacterium]
MTYRRMLTLTTPEQVRDATIGAMTIGLVPIMGTMHEGHLALIRRADLENDETVVVIFDPAGDVPEITPNDLLTANGAGARIFYRPEPDTIFPPDFSTSVRVPGLSANWEGAARLGYFDRVTAFFVVVLNQLQPTRTYVGEKHLQQLMILQRVHDDLNLSGEIVPCVTVRDPDGLPLSSYNARLTDAERLAAVAIPQALFAMQHAARSEENATTLVAIGREITDAQPLLTLEYLAVIAPETFAEVDSISDGDYAIIAATIGETRILDNIHLGAGNANS